jgi:hypothetical protein
VRVVKNVCFARHYSLKHHVINVDLQIQVRTAGHGDVKDAMMFLCSFSLKEPGKRKSNMRRS